MEVSLIALALGAVVGLILALTGAGGGILAVPLLVFGLHLSILQAAPVGSINWDVAVPFGIGAVAALLAGRRVAARVAGSQLQQGFAIVSGRVSVLLLARGMGWVSA